MAEAFTATPVIEEEFVATPIKRERTSDPFKQGLAGLTDIGTGIPMLLGMAGAGIEAGATTLFSEDDSGFGQNFATALSEGFDKTLFDAGFSGREGVNRFLNIKEPISTEDQLARLAGGFIPIPGFRVAAGAGRLAKLARGTANVLTPMVKRGPGFARRGAFQLGIGVTLDQGIRALVDDENFPLLLSEAALSGRGPVPGDDLLGAGGDDEFTATPVPIQTMDPDVDSGNADGLAKLIEFDRRVQKEQDWEDAKFWMLVAGAVIMGGAGVKWIRSGRTDTLGQHARETGNRIFANKIDKAQHLDTAAKDIDIIEPVRDKMVSNAHTDPLDIAVQFTLTGNLGQGFKPKPGMRAHSYYELEANHIALGKENKRLFDEAMLAQTERASQIHGAGELFPNARSAQTLDDIVRQARAIPEVKQLMDDFAETFDVLLDYQTTTLANPRGPLSREVADGMRARATLPDAPGGRIAYMPLYNKDPTTFMQRLARNYLGINSRQGREAAVIAEYGARSLNVGEEILSPLAAIKRYSLSTIAYVNEQSFRGNVLDKFARIERSGDKIRRLVDDKTGEFLKTAREVTYIGKGTDFADIDSIHIDVYTGPGPRTRGGPTKVEAKFKSGSINDLRARWGNAIQTAHVDGELRVYYVPDVGVRAALDLNPRLSPGLAALSHWKNLFTRGTTGEFSLFAPISHLFSQQQVAINTAGREGLFAGAKSIGESLGGTGQLLIANTAGARARFLAKRIARHVAEGDVPPQAMVKLQQTLERRFLDATINQVRMESGRTVTGIGSIAHGTIEDVMERIGKPSSDFFGADQMGLVRELWLGWNNAWHEGPAYGAMRKHFAKVVDEGGTLTSQVIRDGVDISKTVAGDMRRIGSDGFAQVFNASVPFSAAMLQSWNSIGSAFVHDWKRMIVGVSALVGFPTMSELAYNAMLSEASGTFPDQSFIDSGGVRGREWTYSDYYWNGFTTQQRTDNFIYFVPGEPPWDAILVPVSPEWGLFRGTVLEAADAIFGLSNVGDIGMVDQTKVNRSMFLGSLLRVLDIPLPPPLAAAASGLGMDVRLGLATEVRDDPDDPGRVTTMLRIHPIGQGERITRRSGKSRYAQGDLDRTTVAMIQDIFGAAGTAYVNVHEAVASGVRGREGSIPKALNLGLDALGRSLKQQARYVQPLLGKALRPNPNDEIAKSLFASRANLKRLTLQLRNGYLGGGIAYADGQLIIGDTLELPDDPINMELAASASRIEGNIAKLDGRISGLRKDLASMGNATNLGSISEKYDKMDGKTLEIQALKAQQLAVLHDFEAKISDYLSDRYGRDIEIDLTTFAPRPSPQEGSTLQGLLTPPPTTQ